jgi:HKD family nuclease
MIDLYTSPWRHRFTDFLKGIKSDLLVATPFIKVDEAKWLLDNLSIRFSSGLNLQILTDLRSESVLSKSLDIGALLYLITYHKKTIIVNLPRLHAKVYIGDDKRAIITSANLTSPGLDSNFEYGIGISDDVVVQNIKTDIENYSKLGSQVSKEVLSELSTIGQELVKEYEKVQQSARSDFKRKFNDKLRSANVEFIRAQVGRRSAHGVFSEAVLYVLRKRPMTTRELHPLIKQLLPELCDDTVELIIDGQRFGKKWKHHVRNVQQFLKNQGLIAFDGKRWALARK